MNPTHAPQLHLPMQGRPVERAGLRTSAVRPGGVEADSIFDDAFSWIGDQIGGLVDQVTSHPETLLPLLLAAVV